MILVLTLAGVVSAHPGHGNPIVVPSEPSDPGSEPTDTGTKSTSGSTNTATTSKNNAPSSPSGSGSMGTSQEQSEPTTTTSENVSQDVGNVAIYDGTDSEDINSSWPIAALFGVAAILGAVGVYFKGDRIGP